MLSFIRTLEIFLFSLLNFGPYILLSVYLFRNHLRYSKKTTAFICTGLLLIQFATRYLAAFANESSNIFHSVLRLIIFIAGYALAFDLLFGKILFIELIFANVGNFIIIAALYLERTLFPNILHNLYCWHTSVIMIALHALLTIPLFFVLRKFFRPMMLNDSVRNNWNYYWLVPGIFYFIMQYQLNGGAETGLDVIMNPFNVIFLFIINLGSYLIYLLMIRLDSELVKNLELERANHYYDVMKLEFDRLEERIQDARRARHDVRHHMMIMSSYLDDGDYDRLRNYMKDYHDSITKQPSILFCNHIAINNILLYFAYRAREYEIDYDVQLSIPDKVSISDMNISVLLGNLLENAIHACQEIDKTDRFIKIRGNGTENALFFTIDNSCLEKDVRKKNSSGIGLQSAKRIVEQYQGVFSCEKKGTAFYVSFMLNL